LGLCKSRSTDVQLAASLWWGDFEPSYIIRPTDNALVQRISSEQAQKTTIIQHLRISPLHSLSCMS
jgi:hypothetical protein